MSKTALITGASSGIGLAVAEKFIKQRFSVTGVARDFSTLTQQSAVASMKTESIDLSNLDQLVGSLGKKNLKNAFDVVVLNAGYGKFGGIEQFSHQQIRHMVDTNLVSNLFLLKHYLPKMKVQGAGDIIIVGSESALQGARHGAVYCATKFALRGLAQSLRSDCSTSDIRVMLVNPGPVETDFFDELNFKPQEGSEFVIDPHNVADIIYNALSQPRNVVSEEINIQPIKRSFKKKQNIKKG